MKWTGLVFLCLATLACSKGTPAGTPSASGTPAQDDDAFMARMQADHDKLAPALPWLADESHVLWKGDRIGMISHFKLLQEAGVKEIQVNYDEHEGHQIAAVFVVTLPATKCSSCKMTSGKPRPVRTMPNPWPSSRPKITAKSISSTTWTNSTQGKPVSPRIFQGP